MPLDQAVVPTRPRRGGVEWSNLDWPVIAVIGLLHVAALLAVFPAFFSWSGLAISVFLMWFSGGLGITLGYHRLLTHHSFRTPRWFECLLATIGCLALQGGPIAWVGMHRLHHKHSDGDHDPHSPRHGFTWSHILWTLHDELEGIKAEDAAKDLARDPYMRWIDRWFWAPQVVLAGILYGVGYAVGGHWLACSWIIWGIALRTVIAYHGTWFVNSATHTWGYRNFRGTGESSTNLWWVALVSFGEGWHNNHHAHPRSAAHGMRWFEFDMTFWTIRFLSLMGLARNIYLPANIKDAMAESKKSPLIAAAGMPAKLAAQTPA